MSAFGHFKAIGLLPGMGVLVIPGLLAGFTGVELGWGLGLPAVLGFYGGAALLMGLGLTLMIATISMFAKIGKGTLAPWQPTQKLVVRGVYRYLRNPMISGVICLLSAESLVLGSWWVAGWALLFALGNGIYMPLLEEPGLVKRFGEEYQAYRKNVPRWIPRFTPWEQAN